jgi:hypothetical protein
LFTQLTWEDFSDWQQYYAEEPWGEQRADFRNAVAIAYGSVGFLPDSTKLPDITWPYFEDGLADFDVEAHQESLDEYQAVWARWDEERRSK